MQDAPYSKALANFCELMIRLTQITFWNFYVSFPKLEKNYHLCAKTIYSKISQFKYTNIAHEQKGNQSFLFCLFYFFFTLPIFFIFVKISSRAVWRELCSLSRTISVTNSELLFVLNLTVCFQSVGEHFCLTIGWIYFTCICPFCIWSGLGIL